MSGAWIQTFTGRKVFPLDPCPTSIVIDDIAHALSNLCRFTGHTSRFYSVAQHCVHASFCTPEGLVFQRQALLHDAAEAYLNDLASPIKYALGLEPYREADRKLQAMIFERYGLPPEMLPQVKAVDTRMLFTERAQLLVPMMDSASEWGQGHGDDMRPFAFTIRAMSPEEAKRHYLLRFYELFGDVR